jgi:putative tryptophan/tyrosine transport system substrate-binding protein
MRRRTFLATLGAAAMAWPFAARGEAAKIPRVGYLWIGSPEPETNVSKGMKKGLAEHGYVLGRDLIFDARFAEGKPERFPALVSELLAAGADVLVPLGNAAALAAHRATATVPIVCGGGDDLVGIGLAASLAHPGGNVTGVDVQAVDYRAKWLEILKAVAPNVRNVAVLADANETPAVMKLKDAAPRFGVTLTFLSSLPPDLDSSLAAIASGRFDGLIVNDNPSLFPLTPRIAPLVAGSRTPAVYGVAGEARQGGLIAYSFDAFDAGLRVADYVDRILKGAHAGDLPIEHPTKFITIVNLKTAKALGLDIPPTLLAGADEVIE